MDEKNTSAFSKLNLPDVEVVKSSRFTIWLIPLLAVILGAWLVYQNLLGQGVKITITFSSGEGIVSRETVLKYGGVEIGRVNSVGLSEDKNRVIVKAKLKKPAADFAREGTEFWVVRPRLDLRGVSGLDTLISGEYIKVRPGRGKNMTDFIGLDNPPFGDPDAPGLHIILESDKLGSLSEGASVLFREIEVGRVEGHKLSKDENKVQIHVYIYEKCSTLVRENTRFWNESGISVSADLSGIKVTTGSFASILSGGIAFETPESNRADEIARNGAVFKLYNNKESAMEGGIPVKISFNTGEGLVVGRTLVKYKGLTVGKITDIDVSEELKGVIVSILLKDAAEQLAVDGSQFWVVRPRFGSQGISGIDTLISGQYIEVRPGKGAPRFDFSGIEDPPLGDPDAPGLHIQLSADELGSLSGGAPVYYRQIKVGEIHGHELSKDKNSVLIGLYIYEKYAFLVEENTRFWNISGINVSADLSGINISTSTLSALIDGGVSFETPNTGTKGKPAKNNMIFKLYDEYESAMEGGIPISITFKTGEGLESGRTLIKYQGMVVGKVKNVELNKNMDGVSVSALINDAAADLAREGSYFWVARPRFSLDGISDLNTLLMGQYIEVQRGNGKPAKDFIGHEEPPVGDPNIHGLHIVLETRELGMLKVGVPVFYKDFEVGKLEGVELSEDKQKVNVHAFIYEKYSGLVNDDTRFWNMGGVDVSADFSGVKVKSRPLLAILYGGVAFETPGLDKKKNPVKSSQVFRLYDDYESAMSGGLPITITFENGKGLKIGSTQVKYKGTTIGKLKDVKLNQTLDGIIATVLIDDPYTGLVKKGSKFWIVSPRLGLAGVSGLDTLISGEYIEVLPGEGPLETSFDGLMDSPFGDGKEPLKIFLLSDRLGSVAVKAPVYYRQIKVGEVAGHSLTASADRVSIEVHIEQQYQSLVREKSKFWDVSGIEASLNLSGLKINTGSIESLLAGGIAFATPNNKAMGNTIEDGAVFLLHKKPDANWLKWRPSIPLALQTKSE